jgi:cation diffusion facilitator CzcD-associated flavoprotein CzcO
MIDLQRRVAIIGAGVGGLSQAIALKTTLGFHNFTIYEKGSEVGGVWRANTYPVWLTTENAEYCSPQGF